MSESGVAEKLRREVKFTLLKASAAMDMAVEFDRGGVSPNMFACLGEDGGDYIEALKTLMSFTFAFLPKDSVEEEAAIRESLKGYETGLRNWIGPL